MASIPIARLGGAKTPGDTVNGGVSYGLSEGVLAMTGKSWLANPPQRIECGCEQ